MPNVSNNHQEYNARVLEKVGAAKIILNKDLTKEGLNKQIEDILLDTKKMEQMGQNAKKIAVTNVENKIYEEVKKLVKE